MSNHQAKEFEHRVSEAFMKVPGCLVERLPDQLSKFKGSTNPSDFIVYKQPTLYYIECKTTEQSTLNFNNITQWQDLLERSRVPGVIAGVIVWYVNEEQAATNFVDIRLLECLKQEGYKSLPWDCRWAIDPAIKITGWSEYWCNIKGDKKRKYYEYDMDRFFNSIKYIYGGVE